MVDTIIFEDENVEINLEASDAEFSGSDHFSEQMLENEYSPVVKIQI